MTCQALKGVQAVGQLHTAMNQVGQSFFETEGSSDSYNNRLTADSSCIW